MTSQTQNNTVLVVGDNGLQGSVQWPAAGQPLPTSVEVVLNDGRRMVVPATLLQPRPEGTFYLPLGPSDLAVGDNKIAELNEAKVIPLVEEHLEIHKRRVETGKVRVTKSVETHQEVVDLPLQGEEITLERVLVERFVAEAPPIRREGDLIIIPVMEEVLIVEKRLRVREEIRLTIQRTQTHKPITVLLRKESANVERVPVE